VPKKLKTSNRHDSQRGWFAHALYNEMVENDSIVVLVGDVGYGMFDKIREDFPDRFYNCGASEQAMLDIGVGLALSGKLPIIYSITPFVLYRGFETLRLYLNHEKARVILVGSGRNRDYERDGFSHWSEEDRKVLRLFPNIKGCWPNTKKQAVVCFKYALAEEGPCYLNLRR